MNMKKTLFFAFLLLLSALAMAQSTKKVAILEIVDKENKVSYEVKLQLKNSLTSAISNMPGYEGFDGVDMSSKKGEKDFQRTGYVSDVQIKNIGEMTGASSILVAEATFYDDSHIVVTAKTLNVKTASVENTASSQIASNDHEAMRNSCNQLVANLFGGNAYSRSQGAATLTFTVGNVSFEMIKVEAGSFIMGCTSEQGSDCDEDEKSYHRVTISQDYYIGKYEVTQALYEAVMGSNPSRWKVYNRPVDKVSWDDAQEFCAELSRITGRKFTLPTEAEWEYAARGGKKTANTKYSGSSSAADVAWYASNSGSQTHSVGQLRPNELGIYDMSGNVWEWCLDWYGNYSGASQINPMGPDSGSDRVLRGGSWINGVGGCRITSRNYYDPDSHVSYYGFRIVLH